MGLKFFPPRNFIFGVQSQSTYDVGTGYRYGTIAAAIAAAQVDSATKAVIVLHNDLTEDVSLPRGMNLIGPLQQGVATVTLTGAFTTAAGSGTSNVVGITLVGSGVGTTISANAGTGMWMSECIVSNSGDNALMFSSAGANLSFFNCTFISSAATAPMFDMMEGNITINECGGLQPTSGLFANIAGGSLTASGSGAVGKVTTSGTGSFNFTDTGVSVVTGVCIDHSGGSSSLIRCNLSGSNPGDQVISGTGQIYYADCPQINQAMGVPTTLDLRPYPKLPDPFYPGPYELSVGETLFPSIWRKIRVVSDGGAVTLTSTPNIDTSTLSDGDILYIEGTSDANTITFQDEANLANSGLILRGGQNVTLGDQDNLTLIYNAGDGLLIQTESPLVVQTADLANSSVTYAKIQNVSATDKVLGRSTAGAGVVEEIACTAAGRALIDDASASDQRTTLGLGTIATQAANSVSITGGSITGITDLAVADGGTGASNATDARTNLGLGSIATQAASAVAITGGAIALTGRMQELQGADVASANDLTLGSDGNTFEITGNTQINAITTTGWQNGSKVRLLFASTPTVKHNTAGGANTAPCLLAGSGDAAMTAGSQLILCLNEIGGTQAWREDSRRFV